MTNKQTVTFDQGRFWYDANGVSRTASDKEIAIEFVQLQSRLRAAEAQKERCAGLTAGEWRNLFIRTQQQWEAAESELKALKQSPKESVCTSSY